MSQHSKNSQQLRYPIDTESDVGYHVLKRKLAYIKLANIELIKQLNNRPFNPVIIDACGKLLHAHVKPVVTGKTSGNVEVKRLFKRTNTVVGGYHAQLS